MPWAGVTLALLSLAAPVAATPATAADHVRLALLSLSAPVAARSAAEPDHAEPADHPGAAWFACEAGSAPFLGPRLRLTLAGQGRLAVAAERTRDATPPPCVADFCQPRVDVPGLGGVRRRASRSELFVSLLDRARVEPFASIAWFFVVTGLRVDWTPAAMDESYGASAGGWGNLFVRLRLRVDAWNVPVLPVRPRERMRREREVERRAVAGGVAT